MVEHRVLDDEELGEHDRAVLFVIFILALFR